MSETTPRERIVLDPGDICAECGGPLRLVGENVTKILDFISAKLKVMETAWLKKSCRHCETMVQPAAPPRPIPHGMASSGLLAHVLVSKFDDHLPLYRQSKIFARQGADIPRSTLIDWCGQTVAVLRPLSMLIRAEVMGSNRLYGDDTPIKVLDHTNSASTERRAASRKTGSGLCAWCGGDPPAAAYWF